MVKDLDMAIYYHTTINLQKKSLELRKQAGEITWDREMIRPDSPVQIKQGSL